MKAPVSRNRMAEAEQAEDGADAEEEQTNYPQVQQHGDSIIVGDEILDVFTSATIDSSVENTGTGVGVVWKNPAVPKGSIWQNREVPDGFETGREYMTTVYDAAGANDNTDEEIMEAKDRLVEAGAIDATDVEIEIQSSQQGTKALVDGEDISITSTDYKVAGPETADEVSIDDTVLGIDVGGGTFPAEEVETFEEDAVLAWYGGMAGQFIMGALDFNGRPSARYKDDGYLVKGLFQHPLGWFDRDAEDYDVATTDRSKLARDPSNGGMGRPPRVARPPILREDVKGESVFIEIYKQNGMNYVTTAFNDFEGDDWEEATAIMPTYEGDRSHEEVLAEEFENPNEVYALYHGEGWQPKPDNAYDVMQTGDNESDASFDIPDADGGDGDTEEDTERYHPTADEEKFGHMIAEKIAGREDADPDEPIFQGSTMTELIEANTDSFEGEPNIPAIRRVVYENTDHLDASTLD